MIVCLEKINNRKFLLKLNHLTGMNFKIIVPFLLTGICLSAGCQSNSNIKNTSQSDTAIALKADSIAGKDTITATVDDCIFDNDMERLTKDAVSEFDPALKGVWDTTTHQLTVNLRNGDRLQLMIGGCNHFIYDAYLETDIPFENTSELLQKMVWITSSFFGKGYGEDYQRIVDKKQYQLSRTEIDDNKDTVHYYDITEPSAEPDNMIREGFYLYDKGQKGAAIRVSFYMN